MVQFNDNKQKSIAGTNQGLYLESVFVDYRRNYKTKKLDKEKTPSIKAVIRKGRTNNKPEVNYKGAYLTNFSLLNNNGQIVGHSHQDFLSLNTLNSILKVNQKQPLTVDDLRKQADKSAAGDHHPLFNIHDGLGFNGNIFPMNRGLRTINGLTNPKYDARAANCYIINPKPEKIMPSAIPFDPQKELNANQASRDARELAIKKAKAELDGQAPKADAPATPKTPNEKTPETNAGQEITADQWMPASPEYDDSEMDFGPLR